MTNRSQANGSRVQEALHDAALILGAGAVVGLGGAGVDLAMFHFYPPSPGHKWPIIFGQVISPILYAGCLGGINVWEAIRNTPGGDARSIQARGNGIDGGGRPGSGPSLNSSGKPSFLDR
ncbi:MAG TPA: hypothetical protein PKB15_00455 [Acidimicrobiia bacterium]|nr:hypothetical protein [Acidimicrobiia bacterium]